MCVGEKEPEYVACSSRGLGEAERGLCEYVAWEECAKEGV